VVTISTIDLVRVAIAQLRSEGAKRILVALGTKPWGDIRERAAALGMTRREDEMLRVSIVEHRPELDGNEWSDILLEDMDKCANSTN
jgi:hypothetical protein